MTSMIVRAAHSCAVISLVLAPVAAAAANNASSLSNLIGTRAGSAESEMEARDWIMTDGHKGSNASYTYWWNKNRKGCVMVTTRDGRYASITDASAGDCNQKSGGGDDAAKVAAVAGGAALLVALLAHKSGHHDNGQHYDDSQREGDYERGYRDGLHNSAYRNNGSSDAYGSGYQSGVDQRQRELGDSGNGFGGNGSYNNGRYNK